MVDVIVRFDSKGFTNAAKKIVNTTKQNVVDDLFATLKRRSPVRSGKFRKSWNKSVGTTRTRISNPQPYAQELEDGKSKQAPLGVVNPSINEVIRRQQNRRTIK